jgi:16S rRNA G966 N2-methylase RsmD
VGLEALSRGAARVAFVERAAAALKVLDGNLARLGIGEGVSVHRKSVSAFLRSVIGPNPRQEKNEVVFLDPPYDEAEEYSIALELLGGTTQTILAPSAVVIAEHRRKSALGERYGSLRRTRLLEQGDAALSFYAVQS